MIEYNPGILFLVLAIVCIVFIQYGLRKVLLASGYQIEKQRKIILISIFGIDVWMIGVGVIAYLGFFRDFSTLPPKPVMAILIPVILLFLISFTKTGKWLLTLTPVYWLILFQSFRIVVEIILWLTYKKGLIPVQMTFEGRNYDVLIGLLAPVATWLMIKNPLRWKKISITYNLIGLVLLFNILFIAVLSMPTKFRYFMNEPANTIVAEFPYIYLPAVLVVLAAIMHIWSIRQVFLIKEDQTFNEHRIINQG